MKNLFITAVFALGSLTAFAQEAETTEVNDAATEVQSEAIDATVEGQEEATEAVAEGTEVPAEGQEAATQEDFNEIAVEELPEAIISVIETNYPSASLDGAAKNEAGHYKVEVSLEDGTSGALIVDEEGNAIEL